MHDPDAELVARAGRGDRDAASILMTRHMPKLLTVARRMLGGDTEAEDAVQEVFLRAWLQAPRWRPGQARFETWLYRVMLNQCYDRLRKRRPAPLDEAMQVPDSGPAPDSGVQQAALAAQIEAALAALPARQRAAILLCHYRDCGNIEAAEILGLSVEALESLLARGRRALRRRLEHLKGILED